MGNREERYTPERLVKCRNFSRAFCIAVHFSSLGIQIYGVHTHNMRAHGVKQKPPVCVCARARARACADHEYVWVFLRKIRACPFCPVRLVCACEIKGCRPPPVLSSSPSVAHACIFPPSFSLLLIRSFFFFLPLFIPILYVDYATVSSISYVTAFSLLTAIVRNVYQQMRQ